MNHAEQQWAVHTMMQRAKDGNSEALHDLVDFARMAPSWCSENVINTLADLLATSGASSFQRTAIESLRGTTVFSRIEEEAAINRLTWHVRRGDFQALSDLIRMVRHRPYTKHPKVIEALVDVLTDKAASREQRDVVESLRDHPIFREISKRQQDRGLVNLMQEATGGNINALKDLIQLVRSERFLEDRRIAETLADIFLSGSSSRDQKTLIWSMRDQPVYRETWEETKEKEVSGIDELGRPGGYKIDVSVTHSNTYTFVQFLQSYRSPQLEHLLGEESRY